MGLAQVFRLAYVHIWVVLVVLSPWRDWTIFALSLEKQVLTLC